MESASAAGLPVLLADVGGTNARFAAMDLASGSWLGHWTAAVAEFNNIDAAIEQALLELAAAGDLQAACIAIAGPVSHDWVEVSNSPWCFSIRDLGARFGWPQLLVLNDFHAAAYGAIGLTPAQYLAIGNAGPGPAAPSAIIGPGTGLGVAGLLPELLPAADPGGEVVWTALATEGGHARFAPVDAEELAILDYLLGELGTVQREDILSGQGLLRLHRAMAAIHGLDEPVPERPADITSAALRDNQSHAARVLQRFCAILGSVAADVALDLGVRGRLFLAGGILPRMADFLVASDFRRRFEDHARFPAYLRDIETLLVTEARLGLLGAANYLRREWNTARLRRE